MEETTDPPKVNEDDLDKGVRGFVKQIIILAIFLVIIILFGMIGVPLWIILFLAAIGVAIFIFGAIRLKSITQGKKQKIIPTKTLDVKH